MPHPVHQNAATGFHNAKAYDAHRPSYPAPAVSSFLADLGVVDSAPGARLLEVAAGTGKFTEVLAARRERFDVVATEPLESMRAELAGKGLGVEVSAGDAASLPVGDGWADVCIAAQAFHWFAHADALREIRRALKPGASFGMIWNIEDYNKPASWPASTPWEQELNDLVFSLPLDGSPRFRDDKWKAIFLESETEELFAASLIENSFRWTVWLDVETLYLRLKTLSQIAVLEGEAKDRFREKFDEILGGGEVVRDDAGRVPISGVTYYACAKRA